MIEASDGIPKIQRADAGIAVQHANGKLTAAERIECLLDPGSFQNCETCKDSDGGDGVLAGRGTVNGRIVFVYAKDATVLGGSLSEAHARKIVKLQTIALRDRAPLIGLFDSVGVRVREAAGALAGLAEIFRQAVRASGVIPQISLIMGPCVGADAFGPGLSDFVFMLREASSLFVSAPDVVKAATNETVNAEELGGASVHAVKSGMADCVYDNDVEALLQMRRLLDFLPACNDAALPEWPSFDDPERREMALDSLVPDDAAMPYDIIELILKILDEGDFFEIQEAHAKNIVIGFGRIAGRTVGIVANQPLVLAGVLDGHAARKAARFVRFCDAFNIPIVSVVDVPGFMPGVAEEHQGVAKQGAKLLFAYAEATVPKVTIVTRYGLGGAYVMMGSKHLGGDIAYAWPSARIGITGAPEGVLTPAVAAEQGLIDAIIPPHETRSRIAQALALLRHKQSESPAKKHGTIPL
ncbi:MAG TPA: acyl-CoA carboxylase subunit beta [Methylovirgula sp.]